jgi:integrase/recombinase XerD
MHHTILNYKKELQSLGYSKNAVNNYPKYAQQLLDFCQELSENITAEDIENYHQYLQNKPNQRRKGLISDSHIYSQLLGIKLYFEFLQKTKIITKNPYLLKIKQSQKDKRELLSQDQIQTLYNCCKTLEELTIMHLCYGCGLRRTELELLDVIDVNFEQELLFIRKGKGKKRRVIPLTTLIVNDLKTYYLDSEPKRKNKTLYGANEPFMIDKYSNRIKGAKAYKIFKKILSRSKTLNPTLYTLHDLRHAIASHLLENEMTIEKVRDFLGHSQLTTTQVYTQIDFLKNKLK